MPSSTYTGILVQSIRYDLAAALAYADVLKRGLEFRRWLLAQRPDLAPLLIKERATRRATSQKGHGTNTAGARFKALRLEAGLTQMGLAVAMGRSVNWVRNREQSRKKNQVIAKPIEFSSLERIVAERRKKTK